MPARMPLLLVSVRVERAVAIADPRMLLGQVPLAIGNRPIALTAAADEAAVLPKVLLHSSVGTNCLALSISNTSSMRSLLAVTCRD